jgi:hypothetical protein
VTVTGREEATLLYQSLHKTCVAYNLHHGEFFSYLTIVFNIPELQVFVDFFVPNRKPWKSSVKAVCEFRFIENLLALWR